jgi:hypothetical protein
LSKSASVCLASVLCPSANDAALPLSFCGSEGVCATAWVKGTLAPTLAMESATASFWNVGSLISSIFYCWREAG